MVDKRQTFGAKKLVKNLSGLTLVVSESYYIPFIENQICNRNTKN